MLHLITMAIGLLGIGFVVITVIHDGYRRRRPPHPMIWLLLACLIGGSGYFATNSSPHWLTTAFNLLFAFGGALASSVCVTDYWLPRRRGGLEP